jgi:hypothetical protein
MLLPIIREGFIANTIRFYMLLLVIKGYIKLLGVGYENN